MVQPSIADPGGKQDRIRRVRITRPSQHRWPSVLEKSSSLWRPRWVRFGDMLMRKSKRRNLFLRLSCWRNHAL